MHLMGWLLHAEGFFRKGLGSKESKIHCLFLGSFHQSDFSVDFLTVAQRGRS